MSHTVGEVAKPASVSVRTLHHYDEIGLLSPTRRSQAGYRLYAHGDLERLQRILGYRELGFERRAEGLAAYFRAAIVANADRHGANA